MTAKCISFVFKSIRKKIFVLGSSSLIQEQEQKKVFNLLEDISEVEVGDTQLSSSIKGDNQTGLIVAELRNMGKILGNYCVQL